MKSPDRKKKIAQGSEEILIAQCKKGDTKAFELLMKKYQRRIFHLIYRITQDTGLVEPLAQDVFVKAFRAINSFKGESQFYTWLYRIVVNTCLSHIKKEASDTTPFDNSSASEQRLYAGDHARLHELDPEQDYARKEFLLHLMKTVRTLPEELRMAIILREFMGLNYEEIGEVLDIPLGTVRSRIFRARERLREALMPYL